MHRCILITPQPLKKEKKNKKNTLCSVFPCFTSLHSLSEQLWRAHTWMPSIWLCVCTCPLTCVYLKRFFSRFLGLITLTSSIVRLDLTAMPITMHIHYRLVNLVLQSGITALISSFLWIRLVIGQSSACVVLTSLWARYNPQVLKWNHSAANSRDLYGLYFFLDKQRIKQCPC